MNSTEKDKMLKTVNIGKHIDTILMEMCNRIGIDYKTVDFNQKDWADTHEWSYEEEKKFQSWLYQYFVTNKDCVILMTQSRSNKEFTAEELKTLVQEFTLLYGWAIEIDLEKHLGNIQENKVNRKKTN